MKKKTIGLDLRPLQTGHRQRGIGLYACELVKNLEALPDFGRFAWVFFAYIDRQGLPKEIVDPPNVSVHQVLRWQSFGRLNFLEEQLKLPVDIWRAKIDLLHILAFDVADTQPVLFSPVPVVVTLPDLIPRVFPKHFPQSKLLRLQRFVFDQAIKKAKKVIAISQATKKDATEYLGLKEEQLKVVYLGPGQNCRQQFLPEEIEEVKKRFGIANDYVLYVGDVDYRKNVKAVLTAFAKFSKLSYSPDLSKLQLVLVGKNFLNKNLGEVQEINQLIAKLGLTNKTIKTGFLESCDLKKLYQGARLLLFPSLYEGFGLTVLEALSCGCPVVMSNTSSLPEVGGEAALYVEDPTDVLEIVDKIREVLGWTQEARNRQQEAGYKQVQKFSWETCAKETLGVYAEILEQSFY